MMKDMANVTIGGTRALTISYIAPTILLATESDALPQAIRT